VVTHDPGLDRGIIAARLDQLGDIDVIGFGLEAAATPIDADVAWLTALVEMRKR
jgi:hypothetical protein